MDYSRTNNSSAVNALCTAVNQLLPSAIAHKIANCAIVQKVEHEHKYASLVYQLDARQQLKNHIGDRPWVHRYHSNLVLECCDNWCEGFLCSCECKYCNIACEIDATPRTTLAGMIRVEELIDMLDEDITDDEEEPEATIYRGG